MSSPPVSPSGPANTATQHASLFGAAPEQQETSNPFPTVPGGFEFSSSSQASPATMPWGTSAVSSPTAGTAPAIASPTAGAVPSSTSPGAGAAPFIASPATQSNNPFFQAPAEMHGAGDTVAARTTEAQGADGTPYLAYLSSNAAPAAPAALASPGQPVEQGLSSNAAPAAWYSAAPADSFPTPLAATSYNPPGASSSAAPFVPSSAAPYAPPSAARAAPSSAAPAAFATAAATAPASAQAPSGAPAPAAAQQQRQIDADAQLAQSLAAMEAPDETQWPIREILWQGRPVKIVMQNENGPCALIALCNYLLLLGALSITPQDRPAASYAYLCDLLVDYLLSRSNESPHGASQLQAVLQVLPKMRHGFQVDPCFDAPNHFASADAGSAGITDELALFRLANVPVLHGWIADSRDGPTFDALRGARSYNEATSLVADADALSHGYVLRAAEDKDMDGVPPALAPEQRGKVQQAVLVQGFLAAYKSQLTPTGISALLQSLRPGQLAVLFRNAHLSVLYRRTWSQGDESAPQLYTLVTDSEFLMEDKIVWESLEDVNGTATRYFSASLDPVRPRASRMEGSDNDYALAMRLQNEERHRARAQRARHGSSRQYADTYRQGAEDTEHGATGGRLQKVLPKALRRHTPQGDHASEKNCTIM
ncbi:hypothetical protein MSPP1_002008 [Malassezia sp. CBS 17886]|nr:hypothetical protein MSPP1_002008 [Malassezia sp. CBS 17886]